MDKKVSEQFNFCSYLPIRFGDPITSVSLSKNNLIIGTMLGRITNYNFILKISQMIQEMSTEDISGIYEEDNAVFICIGDEKFHIYEIESDTHINPAVNETQNYNNESEHLDYCDSCYNFLYKYYLFRLNLARPENDQQLSFAPQDLYYQTKNLKNKRVLSGQIQMSNYIVPFDFNFEKFLWLEFINESERNICVFNFPIIEDGKTEYWKVKISKEFGHISHAKLIHNSNLIFIIRNLNDCEIRECNEDFTIVKSFKNIGDKVISVELICISEPQEENHKIEKEEKNNLIINNSIESSLITHQVNQPLKMDQSKNKNIEEYPTKELTKRRILNFLKIYLLDLEGNINLYEENKIITLTNLYHQQGINFQHKQKKLFSLGYPYILKVLNNNVFAFSCDYGCYCLKRQENI